MVAQASRGARHLEVDPERIVKWVNGFAERHGEIRRTGLSNLEAGTSGASAVSSVTLSAADGATCVLEPFAPGLRASDVWPEMDVGLTDLGWLARWVTPPTAQALILVRRGGYAVGVAQGLELASHKVGTRYVQSRTAAGGWSQHRFARRRDNQADALVVSVVEHAQRVALASPADALVVGGDKALIRDVLTDPRLGKLIPLPRRELYDLPDPRLIVLKQALRRGRAVRITLTEPG
jgi:Actinobacteria/chloroflexi VLRF1 release factor